MDKNLENIARTAFGFIPTSGIEAIEQRYKKELEYGLENGLFTQVDIDKAEIEYKKHIARESLSFISTSGVEGIRVVPKWNEGLEYGLKNGLFTQEDIDEAEVKYEI